MDVNEKIEGEQKPISLSFAPAWKRVLAFVIDLLITGAILSLMIAIVYYKDFELMNNQDDFKMLVTMMSDFMMRNGFQLYVVNFVVEGAYFVLCWMSSGQTLGARILKIAVIGLDKFKLGFLQSVLRYFIIYLCGKLFYIPMIFVMNPVFKQRIMDFFANSVVVDIPEGMTARFQEKPKREFDEYDE